MDPESESKEPSKAESEEQSQQGDELDTILNEWDDSKTEEPAKAAAPQPPASDPMVTELYNRMAEEDLSKAVERVYSNLGDLPAKPNRSFIRDALEGRASGDARIRSAWTQRHASPDKWGKVIDGLASDFKKQFEVTENTDDAADQESAQAFARGSSTKEVPEKPMTNEDLSKMNDREFTEKFFS